MTVTNVDESIPWHQRGFGLEFRMDVPHGADPDNIQLEMFAPPA